MAIYDPELTMGRLAHYTDGTSGVETAITVKIYNCE